MYFFQVADAFSSRTNQMYLPYAVGTLAAKAWSNPEIASVWTLKDIFCRRVPPEEILLQMESPAVAAFSNYIWNFEFNLSMAHLLKERFPSCTVVFGGHNVSPKENLLERFPFIDILIFGEGEEIFEQILLSQKNGTPLDEIPNIAFRKGEAVAATATRPVTGTDYPSPYTMGIFDDILARNPGTQFSAILETNRGCPYHCAYCDWGPLKSKVRMFPIERVEADIRWFSEHKIDYVWGADGNFGLFPRDRYIADLLVVAKKKTGYPQQMKVNYAKLNGDNVFYITKVFAENGLSKSTTMSLQSTSDTALRFAGRKNMSAADFERLITVYRRHHIPTYTELILALPGETKESFFEGIGNIIASGQHSVIEVYDCVVLPNSTLADPAYIEKYGIKTVKLPYIQQHTSGVNFEITEYSETVIATASMTAEDRAACRYLAVVVQCFHSMGLLRNLAIFCYLERGIGYTVFYRKLAEWLKQKTDRAWNIFPQIYEKIRRVNDGVNEQYVYEPSFGDVYWPMDEGAFLEIMVRYDSFFSDVREFVVQLTDLDDVADAVLAFCKTTVRVPAPFAGQVWFQYDFPQYFIAALENAPVKLSKCRCSIDASGFEVYDSFSDYAREIVWFGRRSQKMNMLESDKLRITRDETP